MKILITTATYWPRTDGVQMVTQYQAEGLAKLSHDVTVVTSLVPDYPIQEEHNGVKIHRVDAYNFLYWHKGNKKEYRRTVLDYAKESDALIAVCLQSFAADWLLGIMDAIPCKTFLYLHGMPDFKMHWKQNKGLYNVAKTAFRNIRWGTFYKMHWRQIIKFGKVSHLFYNDNSYRYFSRNGYDSNVVIQNACEDVFLEDKKETGIFEKYGLPKKYFLYVANYGKRKNQLDALYDYYEMQNNKVGMVFVGSVKNRYFTELEQQNHILSQKYPQKKKALLMTEIPRMEITQLTQHALACVMTSTYEYYPITIVEAMGAGIPFICTKVGIVNYLPGGVIAENRAEIIYWMDFFAEHKTLAAELGVIGRNYAKEELSVQRKASQLERELQEL